MRQLNEINWLNEASSMRQFNEFNWLNEAIEFNVEVQ